MPHPTITPSARGIGRGRLRRAATNTAPGIGLGSLPLPGLPVIFIGALGLACLAADSLRADSLAPFEARDIAHGGVTGVAYYTIEPEAYRVVATLVDEAGGPRIQLEALLSDDAAILVSTPTTLGRGGEGVAIRRAGGTVIVQPAGDPQGLPRAALAN